MFFKCMKVALLIFASWVTLNCNSEKQINEKSNIGRNITSSEDNDVKKTTSNSPNSNDLLVYAYSFKVNQVDISKAINDSLNNFQIEKIFHDGSEDTLILISKLVLLKAYLYHLEKANQGYDLYSMRKGKTKVIIDYYLVKNNTDTTGEFLNSGFIYYAEKPKPQNDTVVRSLISEIEIEIKRLTNK